MGRRRQGQDRRLAVRAGRRGRALPGRPQCRPHARHRRRKSTSCRCCPPASCARASSRSSATASCSIPHALVGRDRRASPSRASRSRRENLRVAENATLILSAPPRTRRPARERQRRHQDRHHQARHRPRLRGQGRPPRHPPRWTSPTSTRCRKRSSGCSPTTTRCAAASASTEFDAEAIYEELACVAPKVLPYMDAVWRLLDERAPRRQAHPVRGRAGRAARRRPRHLSVRHLVQHRRRPGGDRLRPRARRASATCSASPRPTRPGSARGRSRPSCTTRPAS